MYSLRWYDWLLTYRYIDPGFRPMKFTSYSVLVRPSLQARDVARHLVPHMVRGDVGELQDLLLVVLVIAVELVREPRHQVDGDPFYIGGLYISHATSPVFRTPSCPRLYSSGHPHSTILYIKVITALISLRITVVGSLFSRLQPLEPAV